MADESAQPPERGPDVPGAGDSHRSHVHGAAFGVVGPENCLRPSAGQSGSTPAAEQVRHAGANRGAVVLPYPALGPCSCAISNALINRLLLWLTTIWLAGGSAAEPLRAQ